MNGQENLIPFSERSEDEVRRMNAKGGINSGKARREKSSIRKMLQQWANSPIKEEKLKKEAQKFGLDTNEGRSLLTMALIKGTMNGNPKYMEKAMALLGEDNATQTEAQDDGFMDALRGSTVKDWEDTDV